MSLSIMLIDVLKFIHLLLTLGLLGLTLFCLILTIHKKAVFKQPENHNLITTLNRILLWLLGFALLTGTLLVYPKHFTFQTPWIQAAYVLVFICGVLIGIVLLFFKQKRKWFWLWGMVYLILLLLLIGVIHDAVTKTTFLFI